MRLIFTFCGLLLFRIGFAQGVGIGTSLPNPSAQLDISSGTRGILIPRMTTTAVSAIANPAKGLMIYDSTRNQLLVNMGSPTAPDWENIVANSGWGLSGSPVSGYGSFVGTTTPFDLNFAIYNSPAGQIDSGFENTFFGYGSVSPLSTAANGSIGNTGMGFQALPLNEGTYNTAQGLQSLFKNGTGSENTATGALALFNNTTGSLNNAMGAEALDYNTSGSYNIAIGVETLGGNVTGSSNTAIGDESLRSTTNSDYNTAVGSLAGTRYDNGYNNVFVGANTDVNGAGYFNVIAIGQGTICTASSQARFGNSATNSIGGYANWTNFSDGRYKKNMKEDVVGLDFIMRLRPLTYNLDVTGIQAHLHTTGQRSPKPLVAARVFRIQAGAATTPSRAADPHIQQTMAEREQEVLSGFSAQEVEKAAQASGYTFSGIDKPKNDNDFYGLRYGDFVVPLVKGMQEQQRMILDMQKQLAQQALQIEQQAEMIKQLLSKK